MNPRSKLNSKGKDRLSKLWSDMVNYMEQRLLECQQQQPGHRDSSDSDSAYQLAMEYGGGLYSGHVSDRARLRNFRKCKTLNPS